MPEKQPRCLLCDAEEVVPIVYGFPTTETFTAAERGEVQLGGCVVFADAPNWYCRKCGYRF